MSLCWIKVVVEWVGLVRWWGRWGVLDGRQELGTGLIGEDREVYQAKADLSGLEREAGEGGVGTKGAGSKMKGGLLGGFGDGTAVQDSSLVEHVGGMIWREG